MFRNITILALLALLGWDYYTAEEGDSAVERAYNAALETAWGEKVAEDVGEWAEEATESVEELSDEAADEMEDLGEEISEDVEEWVE